MGLTSTCGNCGNSKTPDFYAANYCKQCSELVSKARSEAQKDNLDMAVATKQALAQAAHDIHSNRWNPKAPITKGDYWQVGKT